MTIDELYKLEKIDNVQIRFVYKNDRYRCVILKDEKQTKFFNLVLICDEDNPFVVSSNCKSIWITIYNYSGNLCLKDQSQKELINDLKFVDDKDPLKYRIRKFILKPWYKSKIYKVYSNISFSIFAFYHFVIKEIYNKLMSKIK